MVNSYSSRDNLQNTLKDYIETKKENELYKKQIPEMKAEYEKKISDDKIIHSRELKKLLKEIRILMK